MPHPVRRPNSVLVLAIAVASNACATLNAVSNPMDDMRPELASVAREQARTATVPAWQDVVAGGDVDRIVAVPGGRLLVIAARPDIFDNLSGVSAAPGEVRSDGQARFYDAAGRLLWTADSVGRQHAVVLADARVIVLRHHPIAGPRDTPKTRYLALDAASGRVMWRREVDRAHTALMVPGTRLLLLAERVDSAQVRLAAIDVARDTAVWTRVGAARALPRLFAGGQGWFLASGATTDVLALADGHVRESAVAFTAAGVARTTTGFLAFDGKGSVLRLSMDGRRLWLVPGSDSLLAGWAQDSARVILAGTGDGGTRLRALQLTDGRMLWERPAAGQLVSTPVIADTTLVFSTATGDSATMQFWSASSGAAMRQATLPVRVSRTISDSAARLIGAATPATHKLPCPELRGMDANLLPDLVVPYPEHLIVIREDAIGAVSRRTGQVLWWHAVKGAEPTLACARVNAMAAAGFAQARKNPGAAAGVASGLNAASQSLAASNAANSRAASARFEQRVTSGTANTIDYRAEMLNLQMQHDADVMNASFAMTNAIASLGSAIAEARLWYGLFPDRVDRVRRLEETAFASHVDALHGDYLVRAFSRGARTGKGKYSWEVCRSIKHGIQRTCDGFEGRTGVLVVDARSGAWSEVTTGVYESGADEQTLGLQLPTFFDASSRVVVAATGLDSAKWTQGARARYRMETAPQSLLAFDVGKLPMRPAAEYARRRAPLKGGAELTERAGTIKSGVTTTDELRSWFGTPQSQTTSTWTWESLVEVGGVVRYERLQCEVADGRVRACSQGVPDK